MSGEKKKQHNFKLNGLTEAIRIRWEEKTKHHKQAIQKADTGQLSIETKVCGLLEYPTSNFFQKTKTSLPEIFG